MAASINIPVYSDALVALGTAGIIVPVVKRWGLNPVLGYLAAGAILGPLGLGSFVREVPPLYWVTVTDAKNVSGIADLGVVFLLFLIGVELSYDRLMTMRRLVFGLGGLQILVCAAVIAAVAAWSGQTVVVAVVIGASLAVSSTAIVLEILSAEGRLTTSAGRASFAILLAQDLAVVPILMLVSILGAGSGASLTGTISKALIEAAGAVTIIVLVGRWFMRPLFRLVASAQSNELFIAAVLFVVVATGVVAALAGLSMALGAFIAGLLLAETEYRKAIEATIEPFKGLLLGLFFFTVGMSIDARELARYPLLLLVSALALVCLKALAVAGLGRMFKLSWPAAVETALLLGPGGEFAFVAIGLGLTLGVLPATVASFSLALTSLSMALIPLLAILARKLAPMLEHPADIAPELALTPSAAQRHAIVVGYGRVGKVVCSLLKEHGIAFTATDRDPSVITEERRRGHEVFYGDVRNPAFLRACGFKDAAGVIVTTQDKTVTTDIVAQVRKLRPDVLVVARARDADHARDLYAMGASDAVPETIETSLQLSEAALVGLGASTGRVIASIHSRRDEIREDLQHAARLAGREFVRAIRSKSRSSD